MDGAGVVVTCLDVQEGDGDSIVFYAALVIVVLTEGWIDGFIEETHSLDNLLTHSEGVPVREVSDQGELMRGSPRESLQLTRLKPHVITSEGPPVV